MAREFIELAQVYIIPAYSDEKIRVYLARGFSPSRQNLDQDEILQVVKHTFDEVLMMIGQGLLTDALTILSIQHAHMYIQKGQQMRSCSQKWTRMGFCNVVKQILVRRFDL